MGFTFTRLLGTKNYSAGARQPSLGLTAAEGRELQQLRAPGFQGAYSATFASGGAKLLSSGNGATIQVTQPGFGRVAVLLAAWAFRQVAGETPAKVWRESRSANEGGLLAVFEPGAIFEARAYKRPWRRYEVTAEGDLVEVSLTEEVIL